VVAVKGGSNVLLSPEQVAERLGVSRKTVYRRWPSWGLRARKIGPLLKFTERDIDNLIERL
jgi:excisionase family DNA binding protein